MQNVTFTPATDTSTNIRTILLASVIKVKALTC